MKAVLVTLGCKVNQYESEYISSLLENDGWTIVNDITDANACIVNSCTVTAESDRKVRQVLRKVKRTNKDCITVLTGCFPQAFPDECAKLEGADIITGNRTNDIIPELLKKYSGERIIDITPHKTGDPFGKCRVSAFRERTRATIKIQDGCNRFCSYCIIPYARGRVRSKSIADIRAEANSLAENGYREIVLVGINLSAYCGENGENIADAVRTAAEPDGIIRVRLGSLEPDHITDDIIGSLAEIKKFCPQFHISLQSGCDSTLKRMNRHYSADEYRQLCKKLRSAFSNTTLTTDVMVGFAGETEEDFNASLEFVKEIGFEKVHVFPYSRRPGTPAAKMPNQCSNAEKESRAERMAAAAEEIRRQFLEAQTGKTLYVIPEEFSAKGYAHGYTANYTPVVIKQGKFTCGEEIKVKITGVENDRCTGTAE